MRTRHWGSLLVLAGVLLAPIRAEGQGQRVTQLAIAGFPLTLAGTTPDDFEAGFIALGNTSFTVDLTRNVGGGGFSPRVTTVEVRCGTPCPALGAQLQWRRVDLSIWNALTPAFASIETRTAAFNGVNDPWSRAIAWRLLLDWATTPPETTAQVAIDFQLVVTAP